mmetsp:Transcript_6537/g.16159  ORF Transcript_6537/g.16159 Transcript_6537/m.16159 type:complete len:256 (+) Transcript_6537:921-1688(+)
MARRRPCRSAICTPTTRRTCCSASRSPRSPRRATRPRRCWRQRSATTAWAPSASSASRPSSCSRAPLSHRRVPRPTSSWTSSATGWRRRRRSRRPPRWPTRATARAARRCWSLRWPSWARPPPRARRRAAGCRTTCSASPSTTRTRTRTGPPARSAPRPRRSPTASSATRPRGTPSRPRPRTSPTRAARAARARCHGRGRLDRRAQCKVCQAAASHCLPMSKPSRQMCGGAWGPHSTSNDKPNSKIEHLVAVACR